MLLLPYASNSLVMTGTMPLRPYAIQAIHAIHAILDIHAIRQLQNGAWHSVTTVRKSASIQPRTSLTMFGRDFVHSLSFSFGFFTLRAQFAAAPRNEGRGVETRPFVELPLHEGNSYQRLSRKNDRCWI